MGYPEGLRPTDEEEFELGSGKSILIPKATLSFRAWEGDPLPDPYNGKPVLDVRGEPLFAEIAIARVFTNCGWGAVWVDTFRRRLLAGMNEAARLPDRPLQVLEEIYQRAGRRSGCFDVLAWSGNRVMFAEAKRAGKDSIRESQLRWLAAALELGHTVDEFLIVEWSLEGTG